MTRIIALVVALAARTQAFVQPQPLRKASSSLHATPFLLPARARPSRFPRSRDKTVARELATSSSLDATDFLVPARARPSRFPRSRELTTISRDPTLATSVSMAGAALVAWHSVVGAAYWRGSFVLDLPFLVFSLFLFLQTYRTRFVFDGSAFEVTKRNPVWNSSTRLQCERMRQFRRNLFSCASRIRREQSIRPKISQIDRAREF